MLVAIIESIALNDMNTNDCEKKNKVKFIKQEKHMKKVKIMKEPDSANSISRILPFLISIKDIRTCMMLFVVTFFFIISYFPSILATRALLPNDNLVVVYLYLTNSMLNPLIYSFLNKSFRSDLLKLFKCTKSLFRTSLNSNFSTVGKNIAAAI